VKKNLDETKKLVKQKFESQKEKCVKTLEQAKASFNSFIQIQRLEEERKPKEIENLKKKYEDILDTKLRDL
jgi:predicted secreted protein